MKSIGDQSTKTKVKRKTPEIVLREGKPSAVILDIDDYRETLERLEDIEDLNMFKEMTKRPIKFKRLEDFLRVRERNTKQLLKIRGTWSEEEGKAFQKRIKEIRKNWEIP